jgi:hypothetical protein
VTGITATIEYWTVLIFIRIYDLIFFEIACKKHGSRGNRQDSKYDPRRDTINFPIHMGMKCKEVQKMIDRIVIKISANGKIQVCLLIVACLLSCFLASTQHAQSAIKTLIKSESQNRNLIIQKVQVILKIKQRLVVNVPVCGIIGKDFTYDYELNSEGIFQYLPDFSEFRLYAPEKEPLAPEQIRILDASGYWIEIKNDCQGKIRHNYSTHQVQYEDRPYFDLRIEHPSGYEHCNVYFDNYVYLGFPDSSGEVLEAPDLGLNDNPDMNYKVTPAIMQQAVGEGSYHKTFSVRQEWQTTHSDMTLDLTILFEAKKAGMLEVTPSDGLDGSCPSSNCDFKSLAKSYTLTNAGSSLISFNVSKTASWLDLSSTSGVLQPSASTTVTASISVKAQKELKEGEYKDTLIFTNMTNGKGNTSRAVKLEKSELQCWQVTVTGFEVDDSMTPTSYKDKDETIKSLIKKVRFDWKLGGSFILLKEKGVWIFKSGKVTSASVLPIPEFAPSGIYQCQVVVCPKKAPITSLVGSSIFGHVSGGNIQLHWPPAMPSGCLQCKTNAAGLPKTPYEAEFQSVDFTTQIGLESHPLKDGYTMTFTKKKWLQYTISLKKLT